MDLSKFATDRKDILKRAGAKCMRCVNKGERKVELSLQHNECSEIIHMFCDECKRATLLIGGRLRIDKISYKNSTFPFRFQAWLSANAFNM